MTEILLYLFVGIIVLFALDSININFIFKKNKVFQARLFYLLLTLALTHIIVNMMLELITNAKIF